MKQCGYKIYFWSNENGEPIHVHISKGTPTGNSTKVWLTKAGGTVVANNNSEIPGVELKKILRVINDNYFFIIAKWEKYFEGQSVKFYC